jgi:hypothetical protein
MGWDMQHCSSWSTFQASLCSTTLLDLILYLLDDCIMCLVMLLLLIRWQAPLYSTLFSPIFISIYSCIICDQQHRYSRSAVKHQCLLHMFYPQFFSVQLHSGSKSHCTACSGYNFGSNFRSNFGSTVYWDLHFTPATPEVHPHILFYINWARDNSGSRRPKMWPRELIVRIEGQWALVT